MFDMNLFKVLLIMGVAVGGAWCQSCPVDIPDAERRNCYPWDDANQANCEARGCVWCESQQPNFPYCFHNDKVCPSTIPESSRVDCLPSGGDRSDCLANGCIWCETTTPGIPFCFSDPFVSQGGDLCPSGIPQDERIDCHPEEGASMEACVARGCYWCADAPAGIPACFQPREQGYTIQGSVTDTAKGYTATLQRVNTPSWYGADVNTIRVDVEYHTDSRLRIKFSDPNNARYEPPVAIPSPASKAPNPLYDVEFVTSPVFGIKVTRKSNGAILFDSTMGGLIFSDQFLQITTRLNSENFYGLGEHEHQSLKHDMNYRTWGMYTRDEAVTDINLYGVHPFYMNLEGNGENAHGVLFLNANAQEVTLLPSPALTYRTIGGVLDIYMFLGPEPDTVVQQYNMALNPPVMMPYWALGFQLSRWGYTDIDHMKAAVNRMRQYNIPHDVQYGDIDYMLDKKDFTYDPVNFAGLPEYIQELKQQGTRYVIILDPAIYSEDPPGVYEAFDEGNRYDVWVKAADGTTPAQGEVWPGPTYFPDYSKPNTQTWWTQESVKFKGVLDYAGLWIDMNEPANFVHGSPTGCTNNRWNNPPYTPVSIVDKSLYMKTLCADSKQSDGEIFYNAHSLYGWNMAKQSLPAARTATGTRSVVFSRSTFPGAGQWSQHWLGDNFSLWPKLHYSMVGTMEFNMFGFPYVGPDICGFIYDTNEELCLRWQQVGAFFPFSRNHNAEGNIDQDPGVWPAVGQSARDTLLIRYTLLPYLYTLFHEAHTTGSSVVRPLFFEFPLDSTTHSVDAQMLWGSAFLISPVTTVATTTVRAYFPNARWYSYYDGAELSARQSFATLDAPMDFIPLHIRGGYILPTQQPANSTMFSRLNPMGLIVALDDLGSASGQLFWDDGESIDTYENNQYYMATYTALSSGQLTSQIVANGYPGVSSLHMETIRVLGVDTDVTSVTVGGASHSSWTFDQSTRELFITDLNVPLTSTLLVVWS